MKPTLIHSENGNVTPFLYRNTLKNKKIKQIVNPLKEISGGFLFVH